MLYAAGRRSTCSATSPVRASTRAPLTESGRCGRARFRRTRHRRRPSDRAPGPGAWPRPGRRSPRGRRNSQATAIWTMVIPFSSAISIGKMRHLFGPLVKAPNTPKGQGKLAEDRLPVLRPSSQYGLVVCGPVAGPIRYSMRPFRTHSSLRLTAPGANGGEVRPRTRTAAAHWLRSAPNTRASRATHPRRWAQDGALVSPSAADGSATGWAGTMRPRSRARGARTPW